MRNDDRKSVTGWRIVAGLIAVGLCIVLLIGLVTGDISSSRRPYLNRSSDPAFFWAHMILIAIAAATAALFALGRVKPKPPPPDYVAHVSRQTARSFTVLALLGAAGTGYAWISERLSGHESAMPEIAGWTALAMLGIATWPPVLSPGPMRTALRAAGTAAIFLGATMIYLLRR